MTPYYETDNYRRKKMEIDVKAEIQLPMLPNFFRMWDDKTSLPLWAISEEGLKAIGEEWTKELIEKARRLKEKELRETK